MFNTSCIFYQDVAGIVVALGNAVLHQLLSVIVKSSGREASSQGAVGIGQHLGCLYGNNAVQADALLIHLVQYGQCHMEFEYTEQGEGIWSLYRSMSPLSVHTAIPTVAFLPLRRLSIRFSSSDICCARTTVAIQVNKVSMAMKYAFITSISLRGNSHAKIQLLAASC